MVRPSTTIGPETNTLPTSFSITIRNRLTGLRMRKGSVRSSTSLPNALVASTSTVSGRSVGIITSMKIAVAEEESWPLPVRLNEVDQTEGRAGAARGRSRPCMALPSRNCLTRQRGDGKACRMRVHWVVAARPLSLHQIREHRLQRLVSGLDLEEADVRLVSPGRAGLRRSHARRSSQPGCGSRLRP